MVKKLIIKDEWAEEIEKRILGLLVEKKIEPSEQWKRWQKEKQGKKTGESISF